MVGVPRCQNELVKVPGAPSEPQEDESSRVSWDASGRLLGILDEPNSQELMY
jgi:YD repeat-containing protein